MNIIGFMNNEISLEVSDSFKANTINKTDKGMNINAVLSVRNKVSNRICWISVDKAAVNRIRNK